MDPNYSNNQAHIAYIKGGFKYIQTVVAHNKNYPSVITMRQLKSNGVVLHLAKYTWKSAWLKLYNVISLVAQKENGRQNPRTKMLTYRKGLFDVINALARIPSNHLPRVYSRDFYLNQITKDISSAEKRLPGNLPPDIKMRSLAKLVLPHILKGGGGGG